MSHTLPKSSASDRLIYMDLLRVLASFMVVLLHTAAYMTTAFEPLSGGWSVCMIYNCLSRFGVPVFVMISGAFFLDPQKAMPVKKLFSKYIARIAAAYLVWSVIYALESNLPYMKTFSLKTVVSLIVTVFSGYYHLWYLVMLLGLYLIVPFLRKITENEALTKYFLLLFFLFASLFSAAKSLPLLGEYIAKAGNNFYFHFACGFSGYFVLGYYLVSHPLSARMKAFLYIAGAVSVLLTVFGTLWLSERKGSAETILHDNFFPNIVLGSAALLLFFREVISRIRFSDGARTRICTISGGTFGVYLVHILILDLFRYLHLFDRIGSPVIAVPVFAAAIYLIGMVLSLLLKKIPGFGKYCL